MTPKQKLALTLAGSAIALGLFFNKPIGEAYHRIFDKEPKKSYQVKYNTTAYDNNGWHSYTRDHESTVSEEELKTLRENEKSKKIWNLEIKLHDKRDEGK